MAALEVIFAAVMGACLGSFLNVVIYRVPLGLSIVRPASACPSCGTAISAHDNVPILGYLWLRGRCRSCGTKISPRYPIVESAVALIGVGSVIRFRAIEPAAFAGLAAAVLFALALIDLEHRRLPNSIVLPSIVAAAVWVLVLSAIRADWDIAERSLLCGLAAFALLFVIALVSGGMGFGDVKLVGLIGIVTGRFAWQITVSAILVSFIGGGLVAVGLLVAGRKSRKESIPFGPALATGAIVAMFAGAAPVHGLLGI